MKSHSLQQRLLTALMLALLMVLAAALRWPAADHSLWVDELHTSWVVSGSWSDVHERAAEGNYPPLYFWLVWPLVQLLGHSEIVLRSISLTAGVAIVPVAWWAARRLTGSDWAGLFAGLLFAADRLSGIWFSQEARPYALIMLLAIVQITWFHAAATTGDRWRRVGFIAAAAVMFYLHYTTLLLVAGEAAWYFGRWLGAGPPRGDQRGSNATRGTQYSVLSTQYSFFAFALDLLILALFCLPATPHLLDIAARRDQWAQFIEQRPFQEVFTIFPLAAYLAGPALAAVLVGRMITRRDEDIASQQADEGRSSDTRSAGWLLLCCLFVPLTAAWIATWYDEARLFFPRYLLPSFVCVPLLGAWLLSAIRPVAAQIAFGVTALLCVQFTSGPLQAYLEYGDASGHFTEDWRGAVAFVRESAGQDAPVFVDAALVEAELLREGSPDDALRAYLLFPVSGIYPLEDSALLQPLPRWDPRASDPFGLRPYYELLRGRRESWFIIRGRLPAEVVAEELLVWLTQQRIQAQVTAAQDFRGVAVLAIEVGE